MQPDSHPPHDISLSDTHSVNYGLHVLHSEFMQVHARALETARMKDNVRRRARFFHVIQLLGLTRGIAGTTAEAGSFRGLCSLLICEYCKKECPEFQGETHFMIDSFEGLSEPVAVDGEFSKQRYAEQAFTGTSLEHAKQTMAEFPEVTIIQGWIPDAFEHLPDQPYRFVHVDVDIYEPTLASLRYFYPRLSPGGIMVCDDYGPWPDGNWPGCAAAVKEFAAEFEANYATLDTGNVFWIKR